MAKSTADLNEENIREAALLATTMFDNYEKKILDLTNQLRFFKIINATINLAQMLKAILFSCQGNILVSGVAIFLPEDLFLLWPCNSTIIIEISPFKISIINILIWFVYHHS